MQLHTNPPEPQLQGKVCVIAGAGGAIGRAVADRLAREGATVAGIDRQDHAIGALRAIADLAEEAEVRGAFARIHRDARRVDVPYNNAGLVSADDGSALETSVETLDASFAADFRTAWLCCKHGIPYLLRNELPGGLGHQHEFVPGRHGRGHRTDGVQRGQGRGRAAQPRSRRPTRPPRRARERARSRAEEGPNGRREFAVAVSRGSRTPRTAGVPGRR